MIEVARRLGTIIELCGLRNGHWPTLKKLHHKFPCFFCTPLISLQSSHFKVKATPEPSGGSSLLLSPILASLSDNAYGQNLMQLHTGRCGPGPSPQPPSAVSFSTYVYDSLSKTMILTETHVNFMVE